MTYKVGDLVYFDDGVQKGVGTVSRHMDIMNHYQVHSTQLKRECDGMLLNSEWWWFNEDDLKPFTKKVGQKYKVLRNDWGNFEIGDIITLHHIVDDCVSYYKKDSVENFMCDLDHEKCEVEFYADVEDAKEQKENEMFTKEDLKVGYTVKTKSGKFAEVVFLKNEGISILYADRDGLSLRDYGDDLIYNGRAHDIEEVYGYAETWSDLARYGAGDRELLWKRKEVKEMTIEDIQKVLGHKIKVVE